MAPYGVVGLSGFYCSERNRHFSKRTVRHMLKAVDDLDLDTKIELCSFAENCVSMSKLITHCTRFLDLQQCVDHRTVVVYKAECDAKSRGRTGSRIINHNQNIKHTIHKV